jgi:hypothetical protein
LTDFYLGIDPGKSGAIAAISYDGLLDVIRFDATLHDISNWLLMKQNAVHCMIEKVNAMPRQGVASTFKFGRYFGLAEGLLVAHRIPYSFVLPSKWQQEMHCRSKGDKNVTKTRAQQLWPNEKIIHATADAMLIAEYCRLTIG